MEMNFLLAFVLTNILEFAVVYLMLRGREGSLHIAEIVLLCNLLTLPYVWFVFPAFLAMPYFPLLALSEVFALFIEMLLYAASFRNAGALRATFAAVVANALSFLVGFALQ
ncbi:MAG: hypothetical protein Q7T16_05010 [Candidatus Burarchaeum sp.]|nr:hypothetical protein [Candidatus Burarchaeum sp.]MDO8339989.1 hypothetical protein [Candidatus Burarchaeum sp.]